MKTRTLSSEQTIEKILAFWPETIPVFIRFHMLCIGCPIAPFHNLRDACQAHEINLETVDAAVRDAISSGPRQSPTGGAAATQ
jgi:hybrid cluster-associated redox disulfide protein